MKGLNLKLLVVLGLLTVTLWICGFAGLKGKSMLSDNLDFITGPAWDTADGAMEGVIGIQQQIIGISHLKIPNADKAHANHLISDGSHTADEALARMIASGLLSQQLTGQLEEKLADFRSQKKAVTNLYLKGLEDKALEDSFNQTVNELLDFISKLEEQADGKVEGQGQAIKSAKNMAANMIIGMMVVGTLVSVGAYYFSRQAIIAPIRQTAVLLKDIADGDGDLTARLHVTSNDEIGDVATGFNRFVEKLRVVVESVKEVADQLSSSANSLAAASTQARGSLQRQQAETDQVATAMNEMTATVQEVARYAAEAAVSTESANQGSREGKAVVGQAISQIKTLASEIQRAGDVIRELEQDTQQIGSVLDVIKGIAEQTNLLALNAAIEAARAGEQGRGFAVVADEVRALAGRTQMSTEEIQSMIDKLQSSAVHAVQVMEAGQARATESVEQAGKAGISLDEIAHTINNLNQLNLQIATASEQQSGVAEEINRNVIHIRDISAETVDTAEETSSESRRLSDLAKGLQSLIARFRV